MIDRTYITCCITYLRAAPEQNSPAITTIAPKPTALSGGSILVATPVSARYKTMLSTMNEAQGWYLDDATQSRYLSAIVKFIPNDCSDTRFQQVVWHYHFDHQSVAALREARHPEHDRMWNAWMQRVLAILHREGLAWSRDPTHDKDDLAQIARMELARSLPTFHYRSSFSTWAYQVIVRSVERTVRDAQAQKRRTIAESLESLGEIDVPTGEGDDPATEAAARVLYDHVLVILAAHHDSRLATIFGLSAVGDMRTGDIAKLMALHPSRTRALLAEARTLLQSNPKLRSWREGLDG